MDFSPGLTTGGSKLTLASTLLVISTGGWLIIICSCGSSGAAEDGWAPAGNPPALINKTPANRYNAAGKVELLLDLDAPQPVPAGCLWTFEKNELTRELITSYAGYRFSFLRFQPVA